MTRRLRLGLSCALVALFVSEGGRAQPRRGALEVPQRETSFPVFERYVLDPWFHAQKEEWFENAIPAENGPVRLRYKAFVSPENDANLLVIHGYGERFEKYKEFLYDAHRQGFNVFYLEQRGFGRSSRVNPTSSATYVRRFEDYAEDMHRFVREVVESRAPGLQKYVFAHSMGGLVATQLLKREPQLFRAAILSSPMLDLRTDPFPKLVAETVANLFTRLGAPGEYAFGQKPAQTETFDKGYTGSEIRWKAFHDFATQPNEIDYRAHGPSFRWIEESLRASRQAVREDYASTLQTPVLIFQAGRDTLVNPEGQISFCKASPRCELVVSESAKHEIYREVDAIRLPYLQKVFRFYEQHGKTPTTSTRLASP